MKPNIPKKTLTVAFLAALSLVLTARAADDLKAAAQQTIADLQSTDPSTKTYFDNAAGYAVFPGVAKGGLVVGAARGKGVVYERGKPIGMATMTQASFGAQAGGQSFAEVIFFETPHALEDFKSGKFEMGADVSAVAAAEGVGKTAQYKNGVMVFALSQKGLMVQASVGGQKFKYEPIKPSN